jgi:spermidine synthase
MDLLMRRLIFFAFGLSGAAALIYEVVWTRSLSTVMGSSTYALSTMLAAFMAGLSFGGWLGSRLTSKIKRLDRAFGLCELGIGLIGIVSIPAINALTPLYISSFYAFHLSFNAFSFVQFIIAFMVMGIPTTLMGLTFPMLMKLFSEGRTDIGRQSGRLYSINTLGAIAGSVSAGFLLIPLLGLKGAAYTAASLNILVAISIFVLSKNNSMTIIASASVVAMVFTASIVKSPLPFFSYYTANRYLSPEQVKKVLKSVNDSTENIILFTHDGVEGNVSFMNYKGHDILINNGKMETGDDIGFALLAYLPYLTHSGSGETENALSIGLGSGNTLSYLSELNIGQIDSVEINGDIIEANRRFIIPDLFGNPRINHIQADGRNYMLLSKNNYDLIISSPSWAVESSSGELLTDEFFSIAANRLHESGVFATWVDYFMMTEKDLHTILRTFSRNFEHVTAWHIAGNHMILIGSNFNFPYNEEVITDTLTARRPDLSGLYRVAFSEDDVTHLPEGQINTDNKPIIEFHNARNIILGPEFLHRDKGA